MSMRSAIVRQFKNPTGNVGALAGWIMAHRHSNLERNHWTVDLLDIKPDDDVLEIGCGPGVGLAACVEILGAGHVIGLDHSQTMLDQARSRNRKAYGERRLELRLATLEAMPSQAEIFDKIYSVNVVQFFSDQAVAFSKIFSFLKAGGVVATTYMPRIKNPSRSDALKMAEAIVAHMEAVGFVNIAMEELPLKPVPAICVIGQRQ